MKQIEAGHIYFVDGGYFQAVVDELTGQLSLWTYLGLAGYVIGRTGFEISQKGELQDRLFDFESEEQVIFESRGLTVVDLEEVDSTEFYIH
ncbi:MAG: hypothetical protein R2867_37450 [Caldilineaceae bacterium]